MAVQRGARHVVPFATVDGDGLSVELIARALFTGLSGIVVMLLFAGIYDPLFRLITGEAQPGAALHRLHDMGVFLQSLVLLVVPLIVMFRTPERRPALMVLACSGALITFAVSLARGAPDPQTLQFVGLLLLLAVLHPARRHLLRLGEPSWPLLGLAVLAAAPLTAYAVVHIGFDRVGAGPVHGDLGHWQSMAGLALTIAFGALYSACRPDGWRLTAWLVGITAAAFGAISVAMPEQASSVGVVAGIAAIVWGALFAAVAEAISRNDEGSPVKPAPARPRDEVVAR